MGRIGNPAYGPTIPLTMTQSTTRNAGLHVRYEKAGLVLDALPIPWNADAVIVEANVLLPANAARDKHDFTLCLVADGPSMPAELIVPGKKMAPVRVLFRVPTPAQSSTAHVSWREHALGQVEMPIIAKAAFVDGVGVELASVHALLGADTVAGRAFVNTQVKHLFASAIVRSVGPLAAAQDLDLRVAIEPEDGGGGETSISFTSEQRLARQALVIAPLPKLRGVGAYRISWHVADRLLHTQLVRCVSKKTFQRSLRISATRFMVEQDDDSIHTLRSLPARDGKLIVDGFRRVVPCFLVSSGEAGMAGIAPFTVRALVDNVPTTLGIEESLIITDGPTPVLLGSVAANELGRIKHFTLATGDTNLGNLALLPAPPADFTSEGGFVPMDDYLWTPAAEEQLGERLGKLLDEG